MLRPQFKVRSPHPALRTAAIGDSKSSNVVVVRLENDRKKIADMVEGKAAAATRLEPSLPARNTRRDEKKSTANFGV